MRMEGSRTFRATPEAWLGQLCLPMAFFVLLTVTAVNAAGLSPWTAFIGLMVLGLVAALDYALPMVRNWMLLDERSVEGSLNGRHIHIYWTEVLAAWMIERQRRHFLCLGTRDGTLVLPLRFMDDKAIWEHVRSSVPPEALEVSAIQRLPDYRDWAAARDEFADSDEPRMVTDHWLVQVIGWAGMTFFLYGASEVLQSGDFRAVLVFLALAGFSGVMLLSWGITEFSSEVVKRYTLFGNRVIPWKEVRWIELDPLNSVMVLVGENSQLVLPGPSIWSGPARKAALALILAQAERRRIPLRRTFTALGKLSYRTKKKK